eukprot:27238-Hanusia_phi.AAC.1
MRWYPQRADDLVMRFPQLFSLQGLVLCLRPSHCCLQISLLHLPEPPAGSIYRRKRVRCTRARCKIRRAEEGGEGKKEEKEETDNCPHPPILQFSSRGWFARARQAASETAALNGRVNVAKVKEGTHTSLCLRCRHEDRLEHAL